MIVILNEFQKKGISHRNIKLNNFLRCYNNNVKLSDMGLSPLYTHIFKYPQSSYAKLIFKNSKT